MSDLFALPRRCEHRWEGFGLVYLQAGFYGKAVIGGNEGGGTEAISHGQSGLVVEARDIEAVSAGILKLLANKNLRDELGSFGKKRVLEFYNSNRMAGKAYELFSAVFESAPHASRSSIRLLLILQPLRDFGVTLMNQLSLAFSRLIGKIGNIRTQA